ncbi:hypothetical protein PRIPAC_97928 [Pristionchus pacificus]|uniref:Uncharacterized protein n=1 Tax=Pristionchus pacificus TaxID=54126 RepID=A0A2A6D287_PRIPA|nr:hypothetical protein PRIPAC_97928 [Pristionchus pacificus]|eukprot:PDM84525.1 hypothetical protein PRIPAC_33548 [Pristionchus pacificus]
MYFEYSSYPLSAEYWTQDMISSLYRRRVTGFTGSHIVRAIATSPLYKDKSIAAAGRSEAKVRASLKEIADDIGGIEWSLRSGRVRGWVLPGVDRSIVQRSQYYDYHVNGKQPFQISTYFTFGSFSSALFLATWASAFSFMCKYEWSRNFLSAHPELCSFYIFNLFRPPRSVVAPTRRATSVPCVASAALTILEDANTLPRNGGVYTTASAFRDTHIFEYLKSFGITFEMIEDKEKSRL